MTLFIVYGVLLVVTVYATRKGLAAIDRKVAQVNLTLVAPAVDQVHKDVAYRTAQVPGPSSDGSLPIQSSCPKCLEKGRAYFDVVYHEETDRLRVRCGKDAAGGGVYNGCGAKWVELPGDAK